MSTLIPRTAKRPDSRSSRSDAPDPSGGARPHPHHDLLADDRHDPDLLTKIGTLKYKARRWTLGNSGNIVDGTEKEPAWVSLAWLVVPALFALAILYWMLHTGSPT